LVCKNISSKLSPVCDKMKKELKGGRKGRMREGRRKRIEKRGVRGRGGEGRGGGGDK
jgi:hypothetical protein